MEAKETVNSDSPVRAIHKIAGKLAILAIIMPLWTPRSIADGWSTPADPYLAAAQRTGVDLDLIVAIAGAESGFHPYALNVSGQQHFCRSRAEALDLLLHAGTDDVDIGLMQINWRFWGPRSGMTPEELLDPSRNLLFGAQILRAALQRSGSLWHRISNYHSGNARERDRYNQQVYSAYLHYRQGLTQ